MTVLINEEKPSTRLKTDVLVLGGGPAATWAALAAAQSGAKVVLADKGYCGTSGATAPSNTGSWYINKRDEQDKEVEKRLSTAAGLADPEWMYRVMDQSSQALDDLGLSGYPFPVQEDGTQYRANLRGPDYMAHMRRLVHRAGVVILDHHPALELLRADGVIAGASGQNLRSGERWEVHAGAVIIATGGVAFLSRALGCDVNTGDGLLMAAEAGAELSGMEFSAQYGICAAHSSITKGLAFTFANFYLEDGTPLPESSEDRITRIARALVAGNRVFAIMEKGSEEERSWLIRGQPNCFLPFQRIGLDPFKERFEVTLRSEGTVRGVGGLNIVSPECATSVSGLFAAGDAASREKIAGAVSGAGSPNAAWAIASGIWSGKGAAEFAKNITGKNSDRKIQLLGQAGLRPKKGHYEGDFTPDIIKSVKNETLPLNVNYFRNGKRIQQSLTQLESLWADASNYLHGEGRQRARARESAALLASARYIWHSADLRAETRGMNRRTDQPDQLSKLTGHIQVTGTDEIITKLTYTQQQQVYS